ncbi:MAG: hypothetical protein R3Y33_06030 [Clostridia bacterium]
MKGKKLLALLLAMMMTAVSFASCQSTEAESSESSNSSETSTEVEEEVNENMDGDVQLSEPGEFPIVIGDMVTFTVFTSPHLDANSEFDSSINQFSAWYEEKTNIHLEWSIVSSADKTAKLNLIFTSDSYEDIIMNTGWDAATQYTYGQQGFIIPLNEYIENDAYYYPEYVQAGIDCGAWTQSDSDTLIMPDGNIYSAAQYQVAYPSFSSTRLWIYEPWLEALDLEMPTTTDEYYDVLLAFKTQDPNGNGIADEIPLTGSLKGWNTDPLEFLMNSFLYYNSTDKLYADNGDVEIAYAQDEYKDGLTFMNSLAEADLLLIDTYTQDVNGLKNLTTQDVQLVGSVAGGMIASFTTATSGEDGDWQNWTHVSPLEGPDGVQYSRYYTPTPTAKIHITDKCEYARTAYRLIDSMYEHEIGFNGALGMQDEYWRYAEEGEIGLNGEDAKFANILSPSDNGNTATNYAWSQIGVFTSTPGWGPTQAVFGNDPDTDPSTWLFAATDDYLEYKPDSSLIVPSLIFEDDKSEQVVDYTTTLNEYVSQMTTQFILNGGIEEGWDSYISGLQDRGLLELEELYQEAYEQRMETLG